MRAADTDGLLAAFHQLTQQPRALQFGDAVLPAIGAFGVRFRDGGGIHDQISTDDIRRIVADVDNDALLTQGAEKIAVRLVGAGDMIALFQQHAGKT